MAGLMEVLRKWANTVSVGPVMECPSTTIQQGQMTTEPSNTEKNTVMDQKQRKITRSYGRKKSAKITEVKSKKRKVHKMVRDQDLDDEIKSAVNRLNYLRMRKRTGYPGGRKTENPRVRRPKPDPDMFFYESEVKDFKFVKKYNTYKEAFVQSGKMFTAYHNRLSQVIAKLGNDREKEAFQALMPKEEDIN